MKDDEVQRLATIEEKVIGMYTGCPYPNRGAELERVERHFLHTLHYLNMGKELFRDKKVLDAGCGTGELSCCFAMWGAEVIGVDLSITSLQKAKALASEKGLTGVQFAEGSVLALQFPDRYFDIVVCRGVLHCTPAPYLGFTNLTRVLKEGGHLVVGIYNPAGRFGIRLKRRLVHLLAGDDIHARAKLAERLFYRKEPGYYVERFNAIEKMPWIYDNIANPHESYHSIGEVLDWFKRNDIAYLGSWPPIELAKYRRLESLAGALSLTPAEQMRRLAPVAKMIPLDKLNALNHPTTLSGFLVQLLWLLSGTGFYTVSGQAISHPSRQPDADALS